METKAEKLKRFAKKVFLNEYSIVFMILFGIGVGTFLYALLTNHFMLPINGDYVLQTYSFYANGYHQMWDFFKTGEFPLFDYSNFLGANYIGSASFYYLFSPLFYLLLIWPKAWLYQGIFFHMMFKYALGGLLFYVLLRKYFHLKKFTSTIGAIIYSFSGWNLFYIWFHYSDVSALFPLILIGIERCLQERKGGILTLAIFLMGIANYFFFFTFALLGVLYALYRWIYLYGINKRLGHSAKERWGVLLQGILYFIAGGIMASFVVVPSMVVALDSGRGDSQSLIQFLSFFFENPQRLETGLELGKLKGWDFFAWSNIKELLKFIFVWPERQMSATEIISPIQSIGYVFTGFLFMNTDVWSSTVFSTSVLDNTIGGLFITTPMIMMLVPAIIKGFKTKRPWTIFGIIICILMPIIPFSYYLFHGFTIMYGRWLLFIVAIALIFILCTFDQFDQIKKKYILINFLINLGIGIFFVVYSYQHQTLTNIFKIYAVIFQFLYMVVVWLIIGFSYIKWEYLKKILFVMVVGEVAMSAIVTVEMKGYVSYQYFMGGPEKRKEQTQIIEDIQEMDDGFYRIYNILATRGNVNLPSDLSYNGASVFNSIYNFEQKEFIDRSRMAYGGSWSMGYHEKRYYFDQFVGIKYYIVDKRDKNNDTYLNDVFDGRTSLEEEQNLDYRINIPFGYELVRSYEYFDVYENKNFIELGYGLDEYIPWDSVSYQSQSGTIYHNYSASIYEEMYSKMAIVKMEDLEDFEKEGFEKNEAYVRQYYRTSYTKWNKKLSLREDLVGYRIDPITGEVERYQKDYNSIDFDLEDSASRRYIYDFGRNEITSSVVETLLPKNEPFFHQRYDQYGFYGDQLIYELKDGERKVCSLASDDNICYINLPFKMGPRVLISLYNDDVLVTQDAHMDFHSYSNEEYEWKYERGFYVNQPINKIVIEFISDTWLNSVYRSTSTGIAETMLSMNLYYTYEQDIKKTQDQLKKDAVTDVVYNKNDFTFKTNYDKKKIVVLSVPYDAGWSLTRTQNGQEEEVKIYNLNGGFVGFIAKDGEWNYNLSYYTPYLKEGIYLSIAGLALFVAIAVVYAFLIKPPKPVFIDHFLPKVKKEKITENKNKKKKHKKKKKKKKKRRR